MEGADTRPPRYDEDFFAWSQHQAEILRDLAATGRSLAPDLAPDLDVAHVAEEMESLGKEQLHGVKSALMRIVQHLLKLEYSPAVYPRRHWTEEAGNFRSDLADRLDMNPSLRPKLGDLLSDAYTDARRQAVRDMARDRIDTGVLPKVCPYSLEQVQDEEWWLENRYGRGRRS